MKKVWPVIRIPLVVVLVATVALVSTVLMNPQWIKVESIQLELQANSGEALLFQRISTTVTPQVQRLTGKYFWEVSLASIYEVVSRDKRVRTISIYREFPNRVRVEITPHTPVMAYLSKDNRFYPVAKDATLLPALPSGEFPNLPVLRGKELMNDQALREAAIELFEITPNEGSLRKSAISEINYTAKDGFKVFLSSASGEIKIGDTDFGPKVSRVQKVLSYLDSQGIKGRVIDARFSKKVVVRVRKGP